MLDPGVDWLMLCPFGWLCGGLPSLTRFFALTVGSGPSMILLSELEIAVGVGGSLRKVGLGALRLPFESPEPSL